MSDHPDLPHDLNACHALILQLRAERECYLQELEQFRASTAQALALVAELKQTVVEQQATIERLQADNALLKRSIFGPRRERYTQPDPQQGVLFDVMQLPEDEPPAANTSEPPQQEQEEQQQPEPRQRGQGRRRRIFPDFLPRTTVYHKLNEEDIPEELRNDPTAKRFFKKTGETLECEPARMYVEEQYQEVIVRSDEAGQTTMVTAPKPPQLIDSFAGPGLLACLTTSRFADHLPYYRLEDILTRYGYRIARSTQWRWMFALAEGVRPLVDLMWSQALQSLVLGVDETPVRMLSKRKAGCETSYLWGAVGDRWHPYDCFFFTTDRARAGPETFLAGYRGYLQSDAYVCYERIALDSEAIYKVACWAHARRKFEELHFTGATTRTHAAMEYFQRLYDIEDRGKELTDDERHALRQREARPIVAEFHAWLKEQYERELPKSRLRGAIGYMLNRWDAFERYLEHGAIPIDNNRTEACLKFPILGRKAWLFFGNEQGGRAAATLFTLTKSCNRHHIEPYAYLRDVYTQLPTLRQSELETLLPDRWIAEHPEHLIQPRIAESQSRARRTRARRQARRMLAG